MQQRCIKSRCYWYIKQLRCINPDVLLEVKSGEVKCIIETSYFDFSNQLEIIGTAETLATFVDDGAVTLYYNNTAAIATASAAVSFFAVV